MSTTSEFSITIEVPARISTDYVFTPIRVRFESKEQKDIYLAREYTATKEALKFFYESKDRVEAYKRLYWARRNFFINIYREQILKELNTDGQT